MKLFSLAKLKKKILAHTGMSLLSTTMGVAMLGCATVAYATASANLSYAEMDGQSLKIRNILNDFYDDVKKTKYTEIEEKYQNKKFENLDNDVYVKTTIEKRCGNGKDAEICPFVKVVARVFAKSDINGENELDRIEVNRTFAKYFDRPRVFTKDDTLELGEDAVGLRFFAKAQDGEDGQSCGMESKKIKSYDDVTIPAEPTNDGEIGFCDDMLDISNYTIDTIKPENYISRNFKGLNARPMILNKIMGKGAYYKFIYLGKKDLLIKVGSSHYNYPDRFKIFYDEKQIYNSAEMELDTVVYSYKGLNFPHGLNPEDRTIFLEYKADENKPHFLILVMDAPVDGTIWDVIIRCKNSNTLTSASPGVNFIKNSKALLDPSTPFE